MTKKLLFAVFILVVVVAAYLGLLLATAEKGTALEFKTYEDAVSGNAQEDHWIPNFMPESAEQIYVKYGVSPSFLRLEFLTVPDDRNNILGEFRLVTDPTIVERAIHNAEAFDWTHQSDGAWSVYIPAGSTGQDAPTVFLLLGEDEKSIHYMVD